MRRRSAAPSAIAPASATSDVESASPAWPIPIPRARPAANGRFKPIEARLTAIGVHASSSA